MTSFITIQANMNIFTVSFTQFGIKQSTEGRRCHQFGKYCLPSVAARFRNQSYGNLETNSNHHTPLVFRCLAGLVWYFSISHRCLPEEEQGHVDSYSWRWHVVCSGRLRSSLTFQSASTHPKQFALKAAEPF